AAATVTTGRASGRASVATGRTLGRASVVAGLATTRLARRTTPVVAGASSAASRVAHVLGGWADRGLLLFARRAYALARPRAPPPPLPPPPRIPPPPPRSPPIPAPRPASAAPAGRWLRQVRSRGEQDPAGLPVVGLVGGREERGGAHERTDPARLPRDIEDV